MIDYYRKSILSQAGKDAGNKAITEFLSGIVESYDSFLSRIKEEKAKTE